MNWLHESAGPVAVLDPQTVANTAKLSAAVDMSKFHQVTFVFLLGDMANETIDAGVYESDASGGTYTALSGKQATQLAAGASANDNKQIVITVRSEELSSGKRYLKGRLITGGATGGVACIVAYAQPRFGPATDDKAAGVVQVIV
ncbi:MAG: hypothetical protein EBV06_05040 [Planctomycetia bacterium]|nr:hypothetical protein [Planctomycetia bacterium]